MVFATRSTILNNYALARRCWQKLFKRGVLKRYPDRHQAGIKNKDAEQSPGVFEFQKGN
jgi:hypothetical protein